MNAADAVLARGFTRLLEMSGDLVTFRNGTVSAVVNWVPFDDKTFPDTPDFSVKSTSRIEVAKSFLSIAPKVGETFVTEDGKFHRVQSVVFNGYAWLCDCEVA